MSLEKERKDLSGVLDKGEFKKIFDTYYKSLVLFASKYVDDKEDAIDIVHETFLSFWEARDNIREISMVKSYLYSTTRNKALNFNRKNKNSIKVSDENLLKVESEEFLRDYIEEETLRLFYNSINLLPPKAREVILLTIKGYSREEIATSLGISIDTVKYHKKSALSILKDKLGDNFYMIIAIISSVI